MGILEHETEIKDKEAEDILEKNLREPTDAEINKNWKVNKDAFKYIKAGFIGSPSK